MKIAHRRCDIDTRRIDEAFIITATQVDRLLDDPQAYTYSLRARFDLTLTLEHIEVVQLDGSMGRVCMTAERSLEGLLGSRVGAGFGAKAKEVTRTSRSCMHFLPLLQQISTAAYRAQQVLLLEAEGKEAFLAHNKKTYRNRCVGYSAHDSN